MKKMLPIRIPRFPISGLIEIRSIIIITCFVLASFFIFLSSIKMGSFELSYIEILQAIFGRGNPGDVLIIQQFRLPRILTAMLVGSCLAGAGAILQSMIRNPLASPDLIGVTSGASVMAVLFITVFSLPSIHYLPVITFVGALLTTLLLYRLSWLNEITAFRLILIGIGINEAMQAFTKLLLVISPIPNVAKAQLWLTGSVYGSSWLEVSILWIWMLLLLPLVFVFVPTANLHQLGDDVAAGLGNPVQRHRFILLFLSAGLAGIAVAISGPISFIGLIAPHIAKKIIGPAFGSWFLLSLFIGGMVVMLADLIARTAFAPLDLPVGIFTSLIGAPFFLYLLYKHRKK